MAKKILIISPTPTHPQNAGNRARIFNITELLKQNGFEVHFLFAQYEEGDIEAMKAYFGNGFYFFANNVSKKSKSGIRIGKLLGILKKMITLGFSSFQYSRDQFKYNHLVDHYYNEELSGFAQIIQEKEKFEIVLTEYVYISKVLEVFDDEVKKILDLHDLFTDRYKIYLEKGLKPRWYSLFRSEEIKGINRADVLIAIQDEERAILNKMTDKPVILLGHNITPKNNFPTNGPEKRLLLVASHNNINVEGINEFIKNCLSEIKIKHPATKLFLAGSIINSKNKIIEDDSIEFLGQFKDADEIYQKGDVVINPMSFGTGLKIKTIEALSHAKPLVAYKEGISGLKYRGDKPFCLLALDKHEFAEQVCSLLDSQELRNNISSNAAEFIKQYNSNGQKKFLEMFK